MAEAGDPFISTRPGRARSHHSVHLRPARTTQGGASLNRRPTVRWKNGHGLCEPSSAWASTPRARASVTRALCGQTRPSRSEGARRQLELSDTVNDVSRLSATDLQESANGPYAARIVTSVGSSGHSFSPFVPQLLHPDSRRWTIWKRPTGFDVHHVMAYPVDAFIAAVLLDGPTNTVASSALGTSTPIGLSVVFQMRVGASAAR